MYTKAKNSLFIVIASILIFFSCSPKLELNLNRTFLLKQRRWCSFSAEGVLRYRIKRDRYGVEFFYIRIAGKGFRLDLIESITGKLLARTILRSDSLLIYNPIEKECFYAKIKQNTFHRITQLPLTLYDIKFIENGCILKFDEKNLLLRKNTVTWNKDNAYYSLSFDPDSKEVPKPKIFVKSIFKKIVFKCKLKGTYSRTYRHIPKKIRFEVPSIPIIGELRFTKITKAKPIIKFLYPSFPKKTFFYN